MKTTLLSLTHFVITCALCWNSAACLAFDANASAVQLPPNGEAEELTVAEIVEILRRTESVINTLSVSCQSTGKRDLKASMDANAAWHYCRQSVSCTWWVDSQGSWLYSGKSSERWVRNNPRSEKTTLISTFIPPATGKFALLDASTNKVIREGDAGACHLQLNPTEIVGYLDGVSIPTFLQSKDAVIAGTKDLNGRTLTLVEVIDKTSSSIQWRHLFWVDVERGVLPRRQKYVRLAEDEPWELIAMLDCGIYKADVASGLWLPSEAKSFRWDLSNTGQVGRLTHAAYHSLSKWSINPTLPNPDAFLSDSIRTQVGNSPPSVKNPKG
ncbi:hypothetical protein [Aureliella helgolandensis]|uniref:Uncharacterized protein n=1 Tax=Aureliella helgolandensis TaxID=2527968 RepID=A0A518FZD8_9BACT|nr:hypothetical protein [Aureliella helgolandensis]QDV21728.1 hypothetical protein Q31a_00070 [Aureliella helgolandensis]